MTRLYVLLWYHGTALGQFSSNTSTDLSLVTPPLHQDASPTYIPLPIQDVVNWITAECISEDPNQNVPYHVASMEVSPPSLTAIISIDMPIQDFPSLAETVKLHDDYLSGVNITRDISGMVSPSFQFLYTGDMSMRLSTIKPQLVGKVKGVHVSFPQDQSDFVNWYMNLNIQLRTAFDDIPFSLQSDNPVSPPALVFKPTPSSTLTEFVVDTWAMTVQSHATLMAKLFYSSLNIADNTMLKLSLRESSTIEDVRTLLRDEFRLLDLSYSRLTSPRFTFYINTDMLTFTPHLDFEDVGHSLVEARPFYQQPAPERMSVQCWLPKAIGYDTAEELLASTWPMDDTGSKSIALWKVLQSFLACENGADEMRDWVQKSQSKKTRVIYLNVKGRIQRANIHLSEKRLMEQKRPLAANRTGIYIQVAPDQEATVHDRKVSGRILLVRHVCQQELNSPEWTETLQRPPDEGSSLETRRCWQRVTWNRCQSMAKLLFTSLLDDDTEDDDTEDDDTEDEVIAAYRHFWVYSSAKETCPGLFKVIALSEKARDALKAYFKNVNELKDTSEQPPPIAKPVEISCYKPNSGKYHWKAYPILLPSDWPEDSITELSNNGYQNPTIMFPNLHRIEKPLFTSHPHDDITKETSRVRMYIWFPTIVIMTDRQAESLWDKHLFADQKTLRSVVAKTLGKDVPERSVISQKSTNCVELVFPFMANQKSALERLESRLTAKNVVVKTTDTRSPSPLLFVQTRVPSEAVGGHLFLDDESDDPAGHKAYLEKVFETGHQILDALELSEDDVWIYPVTVARSKRPPPRKDGSTSLSWNIVVLTLEAQRRILSTFSTQYRMPHQVQTEFDDTSLIHTVNWHKSRSSITLQSKIADVARRTLIITAEPAAQRKPMQDTIRAHCDPRVAAQLLFFENTISTEVVFPAKASLEQFYTQYVADQKLTIPNNTVTVNTVEPRVVRMEQYWSKAMLDDTVVWTRNTHFESILKLAALLVDRQGVTMPVQGYMAEILRQVDKTWGKDEAHRLYNAVFRMIVSSKKSKEMPSSRQLASLDRFENLRPSEMLTILTKYRYSKDLLDQFEDGKVVHGIA